MTLYKYKNTNPHTAKYSLIMNIIRLNKIAVEMFDIELLKKGELYDIKFDVLQNIEAELRIQTSSKRHMNYNHGL